MISNHEASRFVARVIANRGADLLVRSDDGSHFTAVPQKKLALIVCGDLVVCQPQNANTAADSHRGDAVLVTGIESRKGALQRTDRRGQPKPVAANVTQLVVVTAPKPPFDPLLIDRYTIAAENMGVNLLLVINKADLLSDNDLDMAEAIEKRYSAIGYPLIRCSCSNGQGIEKLQQALSTHVSILVGQSGVGKSSILTCLLPDEEIKTGALSENSGLGRHTTTVTTWYDLPAGGAIIDSAGVRQFSMEHLDGVDIQAGFVEIASHSAACKFRDCTHRHEPDCAVLAALNDGEISRLRYEHFKTIRWPDE